ncbi:MAG TPA: phosphotransferase [Trueperaceae bacterium]
MTVLAAGCGEAEELLSRLGYRLLDCRPLEWKRVQTTPLMIVDTDRGTFVLKLRTPPANLRSRVVAAVADLELSTQAAVYSSLCRQQFDYLRFPALIDTDGRNYLLLEHVDTRPHGEHDLPGGQLLESLLEFQLSDMRLDRSGPHTLLARTREPFALLMRRLLTGIRKQLGWPIARSALEVAFACRSAQPPLERTVVCHNDFHHNNLLLDVQGRVYFSDFEAVTLEDRWVLADIVHYAVGTQTFRIDCDVIGDYAELFAGRTGLALDLTAQLRVGLLARLSKLVLSSVPPAEAVARYRRFLTEVLLDDASFGEWMGGNFGAR